MTSATGMRQAVLLSIQHLCIQMAAKVLRALLSFCSVYVYISICCISAFLFRMYCRSVTNSYGFTQIGCISLEPASCIEVSEPKNRIFILDLQTLVRTRIYALFYVTFSILKQLNMFPNQHVCAAEHIDQWTAYSNRVTLVCGW
jgi:hypothetical protein